MRPNALPPHPTATYVLPRWKVVYVSVPKAACTSMKWLVAELQGEDGERFARSLSREVSRAMCIHRRDMWQRTPMLHELSGEELARIAPANGWFVFAVVRHPSARLFSAWQSKFLLREPYWAQELGGASWFPRVPACTEEVVEDFGRFVRALEHERDERVAGNRHFLPQFDLVRPDLVAYTRIYATREIPELLEELEAHLRRQGWEGALKPRRANETPLEPVAALFDGEVAAAVRRLYGRDLEAFGYEDVVPDVLEPSGQYPDRAFAEIQRLVERSERIGDLALRAQALRRARKETRRRRARQPRPSPVPPASPLRRAVRRVQRKLG
jgi:hypothetical protein